MRTTCSLLLTTVLLLLPVAYATEFTTAKVMAVKAYSSGRIAFWEHNVPIYDNYPLYDITIRVDGKDHLIRYESLTGYYPVAWKVGQEIQVKPERGQFILMNGDEAVPARTVNPSDCVPSNGPSTVFTIGRQVPCE